MLEKIKLKLKRQEFEVVKILVRGGKSELDTWISFGVNKADLDLDYDEYELKVTEEQLQYLKTRVLDLCVELARREKSVNRDVILIDDAVQNVLGELYGTLCYYAGEPSF